MSEKHEFFQTVVAPIPGWLHQGAAIRTADLLDFQETAKVAGAFLEIGVYRGKYFSILAWYARRAGAALVGVDTFAFAAEHEVWAALEPVLGEYRQHAQLIRRRSVDCDAAFLRSAMGGPARFISVDGSHDAPDVLHDLGLAEALLAPGGAVAVDDFLNPVALGVNEAVHRYFSVARPLAPWCYVENKLFLSHPAWAQRYRESLEAVVRDDPVEPHADAYRRHLPLGPHLVEGTLWGHKLLLLP